MQSENMNVRKLLYGLLAFLVAVVFWVYVDEFGDNGNPRSIEETISDIPIYYAGADELANRGLMLLDENTSTSIDLTVKGGRRLVSSLTRENIRVTVNLDDVQRAGIQMVNYQISFLNKGFSANMIQERSINSATVNIKELSRRVVDVRCELTGNVADGYSAGELQLSHDSIEIRGQDDKIAQVSYAKITLDLGKDAVETVSQSLPVRFYDKNNQVIPSDGIYSEEEEIEAMLPVSVTKELKLVLDFKDAPGAALKNVAYEITPRSVTVSGDAAMLRNVDTITLGEFDLLTLLNSETSTHSYPIIIPSGCQNLSGVTRATVQIGFKDILHTTVPTSQFNFINLPSGKDIELLNETVNVKIFGTTADVTAITGDNIRVVIDLSDYSVASGTYTVPAKITIFGDRDIGISGSYQVRLTIRDPEPEIPEDQHPPVGAPTDNTGETR